MNEKINTHYRSTQMEIQDEECECPLWSPQSCRIHFHFLICLLHIAHRMMMMKMCNPGYLFLWCLCRLTSSLYPRYDNVGFCQP